VTRSGPRRSHALRVVAACALFAVAACSDNNKSDPPAELTDFDATVRTEKVWTASVDGEPELRLGLGVTVEGDLAYSAGHEGEVTAWAVKTGKQRWRAKTKVLLGGGPGAGEGLVVVGGRYGEIIALDAATGAERWRSRINSEILSRAAVGGGRVFLRSADGRLHAFDAGNGKSLWSAEQQVPRLSLRGVAPPTLVGELVISGFDNGRVLALAQRDGGTVWEATVAPPSGRTELERLVDIDSSVVVSGDDLFVVTFQGRIARLAVDSGQVWWTRDLSSYRGLAVDDSSVFVATSDGQLVKMARSTGVEDWRQDVLKNRRLSAPALLGEQVAVGDLEGYIHVLDAGTGTLAARLKGGGERIAAAPVVADGLALFQDDGGRLTALRVSPLGKKR
jgi:outer membrane protein assembly factor BamB